MNAAGPKIFPSLFPLHAYACMRFVGLASSTNYCTPSSCPAQLCIINRAFDEALSLSSSFGIPARRFANIFLLSLVSLPKREPRP